MQYLRRISRDIVDRVAKSKSMIVLENLRGIRKLYLGGRHF